MRMLDSMSLLHTVLLLAHVQRMKANYFSDALTASEKICMKNQDCLSQCCLFSNQVYGSCANASKGMVCGEITSPLEPAAVKLFSVCSAAECTSQCCCGDRCCPTTYCIKILQIQSHVCANCNTGCCCNQGCCPTQYCRDALVAMLWAAGIDESTADGAVEKPAMCTRCRSGCCCGDRCCMSFMCQGQEFGYTCRECSSGCCCGLTCCASSYCTAQSHDPLSRLSKYFGTDETKLRFLLHAKGLMALMDRTTGTHHDRLPQARDQPMPEGLEATLFPQTTNMDATANTSTSTSTRRLSSSDEILTKVSGRRSPQISWIPRRGWVWQPSAMRIGSQDHVRPQNIIPNFGHQPDAYFDPQLESIMRPRSPWVITDQLAGDSPELLGGAHSNKQYDGNINLKHTLPPIIKQNQSPAERQRPFSQIGGSSVLGSRFHEGFTMGSYATAGDSHGAMENRRIPIGQHCLSCTTGCCCSFGCCSGTYCKASKRQK